MEHPVLPAVWRDCILRVEDPESSQRLEATDTPSIPASGVRVEPTPREFGHLYASLEREVAGVGDIAVKADGPLVLGVCSSVRGEGKTTVALHLALTVARDTFKRVCLMDLGLAGETSAPTSSRGENATSPGPSSRGESIADRLGLVADGAGLVSAIEDIDNHIPTLQIGGYENLVVIPAGRAPRNPRRLVRSPRLGQLIDSARQTFDIVVVDMPSVASDNALPPALHMDGVIMVARWGATPSDIVAQSIEAIGRDRVVGLVMNRTRSSLPAWLGRRFGRH